MENISVKKFFLFTFASIIIFTSCRATNAASPLEHRNSWDYYGSKGPSKWGVIKDDYRICGMGKHQSPIDISNAMTIPASPISFNFEETPYKLKNNGHNIHIEFPEKTNNYIDIDFVSYKLSNIHFHTPSEHTINGKHYPMEAHLVHKSQHDDYVVVAILLDEDQINEPIDEIFQQRLPGAYQTIDNNKSLDPSHIIPKNLSYYNYMGSFTTPPCNEVVTWFVLTNPLNIAKSQISDFKDKVSKYNARPTQPLNDRKVRKINIS